MASQARAKATRDALVRAGAVVFNREGYDRATQLDIAHEARVTKGALQFHFPTKAVLADAIVADHDTFFRPAIARALDEAPSGAAALFESSASLARQLVEEPVVGAAYRLTMTESEFRPRITAPYRDWEATIAACLRAGVAECDLRPGSDGDATARFVVSSYVGVQSVSDMLMSRTDLIQRVADMWVILLPFIAVPDRTQDLHALMRNSFGHHYVKSRADLGAD